MKYTNWVRARAGEAPVKVRHHAKVDYELFDYGILKKRLWEGDSEDSDEWQAQGTEAALHRCLVENRRRCLDVALLAVSVNVDHSECRATAALVGLDRDDSLVALPANFQFGNRAGVVAFTFDLFGSF